jgi:hypothetical protein
MLTTVYDYGCSILEQYPILINPDDFEIIEWSKCQNWDTLRICCSENWIGIASGFGNTHDQVIKAAKKVGIRDYLSCLDYILYKSGYEFYWNFDVINGKKAIYFKDGLKELFNNRQIEIIKELVKLRA